ncbi:MAG: hypothetical protein IKY27_00345 [Bacteroidales bacterium]|nr:hypothetical protein [Bacteroidales bacterium]
MKKKISLLMVLCMTISILTGCADVSSNVDTTTDIEKTTEIGNTLSSNQATPTDIDYSLERYNLIKRAYWVNGQREKANTLPCAIEKPLGYIVLFTESGSVINQFVVDGKVSSLNSYLTPDSEFYEQKYGSNGYSYGDGNAWLPDVDGSYGENDNGIFFFTVDGKYVEWTGTYLYSDIPFTIENPVVKVEAQYYEEKNI